MPSFDNDKDDLPIPLIDISPFLSPSSPASVRVNTATSLLSALQTSGFLYLTNHPIPTSLITRTFSQSAAFFHSTTQADKDTLAWYSPAANRGYTGMGREKVSQLDKAGADAAREEEGQDLKESLEIGREGEGPGRENMWPTTRQWEGAEAFKRDMLEFFDVCKELHVELMRAFALALGIGEEWFDEYTDRGDNTLRLLHYPKQSREVFRKNKNQVRAGAHSDYGSITLLFQDQAGGLQVQMPDGRFRDVRPVEGAIVVNAGDLLSRWSNDMVKSTIHRVMEPEAPVDRLEHPARYSIAYFCNPNFDKFIDVIPGIVPENEKPKYAGVNSGEYLVQRLSATY